MHWRFALIILIFATIIGVQRMRTSVGQGIESSDIALTVNEWSVINRTSEPITSGIPISPNQVGANWALFDGVTEIPIQTTVLPGIKTPWVLLDFQSTVTASSAKTYTLKQQTPTASHSQPLTFNEDSSQITVTTGTFRTQLSKTNFNVLDTVWIDSNADTVFADGERLVTPSGSSNITVVDVGSGLTFSGQGNQETISWEYQGPLRATLRIDGAYKNGATTLLNYTTRLTWRAGQADVKIEHLIRNSLSTNERWVKLSSAKLNIGTAATTDRIARSGEFIWSNRAAGTSLELIPPSLVISDEYDPYNVTPVQRVQETMNVDANGGMIMADLSYHGASLQLDFTTGLSGPEQTRRSTAAKDPMIALAPEARYSELGAFGQEHFGSYQDEKDTYTKWGWTWPTVGNSWSNEHSRPRVQDMTMSWSTTAGEDFEADELWQNIMMLARVRIPYYLDRMRAFARFWNWEWTMRSDGYAFNGSWGFPSAGSWPAHWYYGNASSRTPIIQPTLTENDTDYINYNAKWGKANNTHVWNAGSIDYYYFTGDKDSLQAAIDLAEQCKMSFANRTPQNSGIHGTGSRYQIRCMQILLRTWEATNDQQWKTAADLLLPLFLSSPHYDQRGFFHSNVTDICNLPEPPSWCAQHSTGKFFNGFPTAVAVDSLYRYYLLTNHQGARTQILQIAQFMRDTALDPVTGFGGTDYIIDSPNPGDVARTADIYGRASRDFVNTMVIGYRLTNDASYLTKAKLAWGRGTKGIEGSEYATDNQVGRWLNSLQAWDPYSGLFPEGGDLHYASFLFYDAARQDTVPPSAVTDLSAP